MINRLKVRIILSALLLMISIAASSQTIWVDDAYPAGASPSADEVWSWVSSNPLPYSGTQCHQSENKAGTHQHYFSGATAGLAINAGDYIICWVNINPAAIPAEILFQINTGNWEHRAYWGANAIGWGTDGTNSRRYIGPIPTVKGQWTPLVFPASVVGIEGQTINGVAFTLQDGQIAWDAFGKAKPSTVAITSNTPAGVIQKGNDRPIYNLNLAVANFPDTLKSLTVTTGGTYTVSEATNFKLWYNADESSLIGASQIGTTIASAASGANLVFSGLNQLIGKDKTGYFIISSDISGSAVDSNTINITSTVFSNIVLTSLLPITKTGTDPVQAGGELKFIGANSSQSDIIRNASFTTLSNISYKDHFLATLVVDKTTQGTWKGKYGSDGYTIESDVTSLPAYASVTWTGQSNGGWNNTTTNVRGLQKAVAADRIAACKYNNSFSAQVNITSPTMKWVRFYIMDWDNTIRRMIIEARDALTNTLITTYNVDQSYTNGWWVSFLYKGNIKFNFISTSTTNATVSGIFFDTPTGIDIDSANSFELARFNIRDGGVSAADADLKPTILKSIKLSVSNSQNLYKIGLFDGSTKIADADPSGIAAFSGFAYSIADNTSGNLSVRAIFAKKVTDNQQIALKILSATTDMSGSNFAALDAGGASSDTTGDANRIEVTAKFLDWTTNVPARAIDSMPFETQPVIMARDTNQNVDLDFNSALTLVCNNGNQLTGTKSAFDKGVVTHTNLTVIAKASDINVLPGAYLTVTAGGFSGNSNTFNIDKPLSGIKIISATKGDYPTIVAACNDLNARGTAPGGVTFILNDGETYPVSYNQFRVNASSLSSKNKPVTFKRSGVAGEPNNPILNYTYDQWNDMLVLNGNVQYLTIDGLKFARLAAGGLDNYVEFQQNGNTAPKNCTFQNCIFDHNNVNAGNNWTFYDWYGWIDSIYFKNNEFIKCSRAMEFENNNAGFQGNIQIIGNKFHDWTGPRLCYMNNKKNIKVLGNDFYNATVNANDSWTSPLALNGIGGKNYIGYNKFHNLANTNNSTGGIISAIHTNTYTGASTNVFNNMAWDLKAVNTTGSVPNAYNAVNFFYGDGSGNDTVANNTVYFDYSSVAANNGGVMVQWNGTTLTTKNNAFFFNATTAALRMYNSWWIGNPTTYFSSLSDNNRYYLAPGAGSIFSSAEFTNSQRKSFKAHQTALATREQASDTFALVASIPLVGLTSPYDLHIKDGSSMGTGLPTSFIPDDIDGDPRDPANPSIGADEAGKNSVNISLSSRLGTEAAQTAIAVTITAGSIVTADKTVDVIISGTGITAGDYTLKTGQVTIPAGSKTATDTIKIVDDADMEGVETMKVALANPSAGIILGKTILDSIIISDNEFPAVNISINADTAWESKSSVIRVTATTAAPVFGYQRVFLKVSGTGITAADYHLSDTVITIADGKTSGSLTFNIKDDAVIEPTDTALIYVQSLSGGIVKGADSSKKILITDNDPITVNISVTPVNGTETAKSAITISAVASQAVFVNENVKVKITGTNITSGDYTLSDTIITILKGATSGSVTLTVKDDSIYEGTESAVATISAPSIGLKLGGTVFKNISIFDNDKITVSVTVSKDTVTEGDTAAITITATALAAVTGNQSVKVRISGTGITAADYALSDSVISIKNGGTTGSVKITVKNDAVYKGNRTLVVSLAAPSAGIALGTPGTANILILDDEPNALSDESNLILVYPNPVNSILNVEMNSKYSGYTITDLSGKVLAEKNIQDENLLSINVKALPAGIYLITFTGKSNAVIRFIKE